MSDESAATEPEIEDVCPIHGPDCKEVDTDTCLSWAAW